MENLKKEINKLIKLSSFDEIVSKLQKINDMFLNGYFLNVSWIKIVPIETEIYYFNEGIFDCGMIHKNGLQKNNFAGLYFHRFNNKSNNIKCAKTTMGGMDVCLSCGKYFLSILIRSAYINNEIISGTNKICQKLKNFLILPKENNPQRFFERLEKENRNVIFKKDKTTKNKVFHQKRIEGIKYSSKNNYELNSLICNELSNINHNFYTQKRKNEILKLINKNEFQRI